MGLDENVLVITEGDRISLRQYGADGDVDLDAEVVIARVSESGATAPVVTLDDFVAEVENGTNATVEASPDTLETLGHELQLHSISEGEPVAGPGLFPSNPAGFGSNSFWTPGPIAAMYLGEVEGGVLAIGAVATSSDALNRARTLLADVTPTLSLLTDDGEVAALPDPADLFAPIGEPNGLGPAFDPDGPPALDGLFQPIEAGTYQLSNLSSLNTLDIGDGWFVAPNFPGFVVILEPPILAPGFRDMVIQQQPNSLTGASLGSTINTEVVGIDDINAFLAAPPPNLIVDNVTEVDVGGVPAVRFDMRVSPEATCQDGDRCTFVLGTPDPTTAKFLSPGAVHRTWWITDLPGGALAFTASAAEADVEWLDNRAQGLIDGLTFTG